MPTRLVVFLTFLLTSLACTTSAQMTELAAKNVFQIKAPSGTGSAFTIKVDGREYLITAKHMVKGLKADGSKQSIEIRKLKQEGQSWSLEWSPLAIRIFLCGDPIDIAVLVPEALIRQDFPLLEPTHESSAVGQEGLFLGFPLGYAAAAGGAGFPFPIAFAKRISLSAIFPEEKLFVFDANNNGGFSGGPILYRDLHPVPPDDLHYTVNAVVSGFIPDLVPTAKWRPLLPGESTTGVEGWRLRPQNGPTEILEDSRIVVPLNTGITLGYSIKYAVDLIKAHPIRCNR